MSEIRIVPAAAEDHPLIADYIGQLYNAAGTVRTGRDVHEQRASDMLAAGPCYLLHRGDAVIGYAALKDMGDHIFVRHFVIDADLRGAGLGARAFGALQAACFPGRQVRLDASCDVPGPRAFWESQGFKVMGYTMRRDAEDAA